MKHHITTILFILFAIFSANAQSNIKQIDFSNFTYEPMCATEESSKITVKDSEFFEEKEVDGFTDRFYFKVFGFTYGDLDGDRKDEAVVLGYCNTGGSGNFYEGFVYGMKNGKPVLLSRIEGGDRAYGGLREARIDNGLLIVERNDAGEHGASCCPEFAVTSRYNLRGKELIETGKTERRELYPKQRVTFAKGTSGMTFKATIPANELKRFVVGARAGQTLTASVSSDKTSIRLIEDAEVTEGINNFVARLPKTGDYTIEIQNLEDSDTEITINVKIR